MIMESKQKIFRQILIGEFFSVGDLVIIESVDVSNKAVRFSVPGNVSPKKKPHIAESRTPQKKRSELLSF